MDPDGNPDQRPAASGTDRPTEPGLSWPLIALVVTLGVSSRLLLITYGDVYDVEAWHKAVAAIEKGNLYANTDAYNYGPIWGYLLLLLSKIVGLFGEASVTNLHLATTLFLTLVDVCNALILVKIVDLKAAILYYLCPVTILVAGFYCQFYGLGLLPGLIAFALVEKARGQLGTMQAVGVAALLGVSLSIKHYLIFYPIWLAMDRRGCGIGPRSVLFTLPYLIFLATFLPFAGDPAAVAAIKRNVFQFEVHGLHALMPQLLEYLAPPDVLGWAYALLAWVPIFHGVKLVWAALMLFTGWHVMRRYPSESLYFYTAAMIAFTPMMIEIYLVIPVVGCVALRRFVAARLYLIVASILLFLNFLDRVLNPDSFVALLNRLISLEAGNADMVRAQIWALLLLITALWRVSPASPSEPGAGTRGVRRPD